MTVTRTGPLNETGCPVRLYYIRFWTFLEYVTSNERTTRTLGRWDPRSTPIEWFVPFQDPDQCGNEVGYRFVGDLYTDSGRLLSVVGFLVGLLVSLYSIRLSLVCLGRVRSSRWVILTLDLFTNNNIRWLTNLTNQRIVIHWLFIYKEFNRLVL